MAEGRSELSAAARALISDDSNEIFLSAASAWEIAVKRDLAFGPSGLGPAARQ